MGGLPVKEDIAKFKAKVHVVVGSPGRLRHLIQDKHINISSVRLFVLDEADKLMESSFLPDINYIFSQLPKQKQVLMSSATYSEKTQSFVSKYVQKAQCVCPSSNNILLGITQKVVIVPQNSNIVKQTKYKYEELQKILNEKQFKQCLVFCNYQVRVGEIHRMLSKDKWPVEQLYGQQVQTDRLDALKTLQEYKCRILVSTDLAARGIDASNVDIVINFEPPIEWETYLHRIGRAGRYGSYGTAITILSDGNEKTKFKETLRLTNIPFDLHDLWNDAPFELAFNETDDLHKKNKVSVTETINIPLHKNNNMSEDVLWKVLSTRSSEEDTKPKISSFLNLCNSFKEESEPNIEGFADFMHSYTIDQNNMCKNDNSIEYKHVKIVELSVDSSKYKDYLEPGCPNVLNGFPNISTTMSNRDSVNNKTESKINYRSLTDKLKNGKKCMTLHGENSKCKSNLLTDDSKICESKVIKNLNTKESNEQPLAAAFDKMGNSKSYSKSYKHIESDHNDKCNGSKTATNADTQITDSANKDSSYNHENRYNESNDYYESDGTQDDPIKQALIDTGLPTAFGKQRQKNKTRMYGNPHYNSGNDIEKLKFKHVSQKPNQQIDKKVKKISSHKTFTKDNPNKNNHLFTSFDESDESESSTHTDYHQNHTFNKVNKHATIATTFSNKLYHQQYKTNKLSQKQPKRNRSKEFDSWYSQLKQQTQAIQYAIYIEELRNL